MKPIFEKGTRKPLTIFVPSGSSRKDRSWLKSLRREGPVVVVPETIDGLEHAVPGNWTWRAPRQSALRDILLEQAARVESPSIEAIRRAACAHPPDPAAEGEGETFAFCCVADTQYVPFFFALVENLSSVHAGPLEIHLLAADDGVESVVRAQYPDRNIHYYSLKDVWGPQQWERISQRPVNLRALSSKPAILLKARQKSKAECLFLLDLDLYFFRSPYRLNHAFGKGHTLFFPQWCDRFTWARLHGIINSGLVGAKKGSEAFISWWTQACWISCEFEEDKGRFVDQAFIDQALLYFDGIEIYRGLDEDVAPWNRHTLKVNWDGPVLQVHGGKRVGSFHAAGPDDDGVFELKYAWDQLVSLFSVMADPDESLALFRNTLEQQRRHWPALNRALNLRKLAKDRLGLPVASLEPQWARLATTQPGSWVFDGLDRMHRVYARLRGHEAQGNGVMDAETASWIDLQRRALFQPEQLLS
jgi:hypothetical protein